MDHRDDTGGMATVVCRYVIPDILQAPKRQKSLANLFQRAVYCTTLRHPLMQDSLVDQENMSPKWSYAPVLNLDELITWHLVEPTEDYNQTRQELLMNQLNSRFNFVVEPADWRIVILRQLLSDTFEAFFTFSSAKYDGRCGKIFHEDMLYYLNFHARRVNLKSPISGHRRALPGAGLHANTLPPAESASEFLLTSFSKGLSFWKKVALGSPPVSLPAKKAQPYKTGVRTLVIPSDVVEEVLSVCRNRWDKTMTALLQGMAIVSLARQLPYTTTMDGFKSVTTIDLRRYVSHSVPVHLAGHQDRPRGPDLTMMNLVVGHVTHQITPDSVARIRAESEHWNTTSNPPEQNRASVFSLKSTHTIWPTLEMYTAKPPRQPGGEPLGPELKAMIWIFASIFRSETKNKIREYAEAPLSPGNSLHVHSKEKSKSTREAPAIQINNLLTIEGLDPAVVKELEDQARRERDMDVSNWDIGTVGLPPAPQQAPWMNKSLNTDGFNLIWKLGEPGLFERRNFSLDLPQKSKGVVFKDWNSEVEKPSKRNGIVFKEWNAELGKFCDPAQDLSQSMDEKFNMVRLGETAIGEEEQKRMHELENNLANKLFHIKRASFAVSPRRDGAPIQMNLFTVNGGDMVIELTYRKGVVDEDVIETLAEDIQGWLPWISKGKSKVEPMMRTFQQMGL